MESASNLSKNLKAVRSVSNTSQLGFSQELGISKSTLHQIEHGKSPTLDTLCCIAENLDIPVSVLLSDDLQPTQLGILRYLLRGMDWFSNAPPEEQAELLEGLDRLSRSLARMKDRLEGNL